MFFCLAERVGEKIPCYLHPNKNFKLPDDSSTPIIMVGPGTGIALFVLLLRNGRQLEHRRRNWLFFGDRSQKTDYLYGEEWESYQKDGILNELISPGLAIRQRKYMFSTKCLRKRNYGAGCSKEQFSMSVEMPGEPRTLIKPAYNSDGRRLNE